jgi:hypothetical protein
MSTMSVLLLRLKLREWATAMMIAPWIMFICVPCNDHGFPLHILHLLVFYMPEAMLMTYDHSSSHIFLLCWQLRQWPWPPLVLFLPSLSACPMIAEVMVNWLPVFSCNHSCMFCLLSLDTPLRDTTDCLFSHILCNYNLLLSMRSEVVLPLPVMLSSFACSLPVIIACDVRLYNVASEHMPYFQGLH